jgi:uncharacterized membrane protein
MSSTQRASRQATSTWLTLGAALSAVCFVVALVSEQIGIESGSVVPTDVAGVIAALPSFDPSAWASLGVYLVLVTPVVGIGITAWEYAGVGDRRTVILALAVLTSLGISLLAVLLR